ncbi:DUF4143 domain-containing protein [Collinsella sp. AGMB00827]|uniref:DUF4143 domain-containing protein n=1 Tax=Collinsella ureilytica TaxID=2869515 RepID=A0ABS7MII3_9ACTN|nr:DUF4143 domain-containing protein [Collinsella urealyticum]MBY4797164.1 DUF4143 domain-containing protein [Collinsella urealyticum]
MFAAARPSVIHATSRQAAALTRGYIDAVCEADISSIDGVTRDPDRVRALITSLAHNESTLASNQALVRDLNGELTRQTAATYLSLLARLHLIEDIPAWNPALRSPIPLRSSKKRHMADPSLAAAALGASKTSLIQNPKTLGLLFESLVLRDLLVYAPVSDARVFHYHDTADLEVNAIVAKRDGTWLALEIKLGAAGIDAACESLRKLRKKMQAEGNMPAVRECVIIGFGAPAHVTEDGIQVIPIDTLAP